MADPKELEGAGGVAADELRQFVERLERLEEDRAAISEDIKEVMAEMKGPGLLIPPHQCSPPYVSKGYPRYSSLK